MATTIDTVVDLQKAHDELAAAEALLDGIPDWMRELHEEYSERRSQIDAAESVLEEAASARRAAEAAVADAQEKLQQYQEQIGRVRNQREYSALLQEIDGIKQVIADNEELGVNALEQHESEEKTLEELRSAFAELEGRYNEHLEKWESEKPGVQEEAEKLRGRIEVLGEQLPKPAYSQFQMLFRRFEGAALAPINELQRPPKAKGGQMWHCGNCNYRVRPQAIVEIRNQGAIVLCDSCKRILYFEAVAAGVEE